MATMDVILYGERPSELGPTSGGVYSKLPYLTLDRLQEGTEPAGRNPTDAQRSTLYLFRVSSSGRSRLFVAFSMVDERRRHWCCNSADVVQVNEIRGLGSDPAEYEASVYLAMTGSPDRSTTSVGDPQATQPACSEVDSFARYRSPIQVRFATRSGVGGARAAAPMRGLRRSCPSATLTVLGEVESDARSCRPTGPSSWTGSATRRSKRPKGFGVTIVDVRLRRTDLPDANKIATFQRMISERRQEAADLRARGPRGPASGSGPLPNRACERSSRPPNRAAPGDPRSGRCPRRGDLSRRLWHPTRGVLFRSTNRCCAIVRPLPMAIPAS